MSWQRISEFPKRHPFWCALGILGFIDFPQWFQSAWGLFRTDAPVPVIRQWLSAQSVTFPTFSPYFITVPIGLLMFVLLFLEQRRQARNFISASGLQASSPIDESEKSPIPDWSIRELFFHIRPSLQTGVDTNYESVSLDIRDKLSTGRLKIWGRRVTFFGDTRPFDEIDPTYWQRADFNYSFLLGELSAPQTTVDQHAGLAEYYELHVNRAQALAIWPKIRTVAEQEAEFDAAFKEATFERNPQSRDAALLRLAQLRGEGVAIRNKAEHLIFTSHLDDWSSEVNKWMNDVIKSIKPVSDSDSEWFATLGEVPNARVPIPNVRLGGAADRMMFVKTFREHDFRLKRLGDLLIKYGVGA